MSKTIRNEKTRGFLDKLQRSRKERKQARDLKADQLFMEESTQAIVQFDCVDVA